MSHIPLRRTMERPYQSPTRDTDGRREMTDGRKGWGEKGRKGWGGGGILMLEGRKRCGEEGVW